MPDDYPIKLFYPESRAIFEEVFPQYRDNSKAVLRLIQKDRSLSKFNAFNTRLKIACGLQFHFSDKLNITKEDTRACYELMYRIADIWYAFEHLLKIAETEIPLASNSRTSPFTTETLKAIGLDQVERCFSNLVAANVTKESKWRQELYKVLAYFINNTKGGTQKALKGCQRTVKEKKPFEFEHLLALAYGLRNLYVHEGVMAALGTTDYKLKRRLYQVILDNLILSSLVIGKEYARCVIFRFESVELNLDFNQQTDKD